MLSVDVRRNLGQFQLDARFDAGPGITVLFGRSGSGKTSLMQCLAGLAKPDQGRIAVNGHTLFDAENGIDLPPEDRRLGYVFQDARLFPHLDVKANLRYGINRMAREKQAGEFDKVVALLGLENLLKRRPASLSGGERQRVAIGRALLSGPEILLMDEPLASLDGDRKAEILPYIENLRDTLQRPIVYVSHAMEEVVRLADTLVVFSQGRVKASGPVEDIMTRLDLRPLTGRYEAGAVVGVSVMGHDKQHGLTALRFEGGIMHVPQIDMDPGASLRVRIRAHEVSLSITEPQGLSVLNVFEGTVEDIEEGHGANVDVLVNVGAPLVARVPRKSLVDLDIRPGKRVYTIVKDVVVDRRGPQQGQRPFL